jgi:dipeptidyl aminopeptidase/acylaminoacyl peptidase
VWAGDELLVGAEDHGSVHVVAATIADHRVVVGGERVVRSFDLAGSTLAFVATSVTEPSELWVSDTEGKETRRLTDHSATFTSRVTLAEPERFTATSADGTEVECWVMAPGNADPSGRYPAVVNIHGGPFTQYGYGFFDEFQLQAGAGIGVIYCNPRGSSGYSEAWGRAIRWPEATDDPGSAWGGVDYDDVMACATEAVRRFPWIDGDRLGVQGGSYGGYLTSWIVGHTDRFAAAISERAVNNLVTMEHNSDISGFFREYAGWTHLQRPDILARQSPATYVEAMTTPMLLMHSENDLRCPISQAEELFVALRLLGRHPELVRFPAENHELSRNGSPRHRIMRAEIILEWFHRHLGAAGA